MRGCDYLNADFETKKLMSMRDNLRARVAELEDREATKQMKQELINEIMELEKRYAELTEKPVE